MREDIVVVDLGIGNLANVEKALRGERSDDPYDIESADKLVLPGVGNFGEVMDALEPLKPALTDALEEGKPFLGICLGMQLLFSNSEEDKGKGLRIFKGKVIRFKKLPPPHIGWNTVDLKDELNLFEGISEENYFYFVHSYYVEPKDPRLISAYTNYRKGNKESKFPSVISYKNIHGVQFHPEKSSKTGLRMLKNFKNI